MDNWMIEYKELILKGEKRAARELVLAEIPDCLLYTSPSPETAN